MENINQILNSEQSIINKTKKIQTLAKNLGFDWKKKEYSWKKVEEEIEELKVEVNNKDYEKQKDEFGDLMFALINYSRFLNIDLEDALFNANQKFIRRFLKTEKLIKKERRKMNELDQKELMSFWEKAKIQLK